MKQIVIPTFSDPFYDMTVTLDGQAYTFDFRFNQSDQVWSFSLSLEDGTPLVKGVRVICGINLLWRCRHPNKPKGLLTGIPSSTSVDATPPRQDELGDGKRVTLIYITP